jgi:hypothetical protein
MKDNKTGHKPCCNRVEFEQIKKLHEVFTFLFEPPAGTGDTEYSTKKRELLYLVELVWPKIETLCKEFGISLDIREWKMGTNPAILDYARRWCGQKPLTTYNLSDEVETKTITLGILKEMIQYMERPWGTYSFRQSINRQGDLSGARKYDDPFGTLKRIFDDVFVRLAMYFNSDTQDSPAGKVGVEKKRTPNDLIRLVVAIQRYSVSRATLKRAIENGQIKSHRPVKSKNNSPHLVSESEIASHFPRR